MWRLAPGYRLQLVRCVLTLAPDAKLHAEHPQVRSFKLSARSDVAPTKKHPICWQLPARFEGDCTVLTTFLPTNPPFLNTRNVSTYGATFAFPTFGLISVAMLDWTSLRKMAKCTLQALQISHRVQASSRFPSCTSIFQIPIVYQHLPDSHRVSASSRFPSCTSIFQIQFPLGVSASSTYHNLLSSIVLAFGAG
jgi:hypothetical protein